MGKLVAGLVALAAVLPICAICVLGPAAIGAMFAGAAAWLGGAGALLSIGLAIVGGLLVYRTVRRRRARWHHLASASAEAPRLHRRQHAGGS